MLERRTRRIGRSAWVMAWVGLVVGQLHALSRFATERGRADLELPLTRAWAEPAARVLAPFLDWADPHLVYVTFGKVWFPVFLATVLCADAVRRRRRPRGFERWVWGAAVSVYALLASGAFLAYWTQWTGGHPEEGSLESTLFGAGFVVSAAALVLALLVSTVLGGLLLVQRTRPVAPSLLLLGCLPLAVGIVQVTSMGSAVLPVVLALGLLGRRIASEPVPAGEPRTAALA